MNCDSVRKQLDDYLDGELDLRESEPVREHLVSCSRCREERDRLENLIREAGTLRADELPARDLWDGIRDRIGQKAGAGAQGWVLAAAAAALFLAVLAGPGIPGRDWEPDAGPGVDASYEEADRRFAAVRRELLDELGSGNSRIDPATVQAIRHGLKVMDRSSAEIRKALAADPAHPGMRRMLLASYRHQAKLLTRIRAYPETI